MPVSIRSIDSRHGEALASAVGSAQVAPVRGNSLAPTGTCCEGLGVQCGSAWRVLREIVRRVWRMPSLDVSLKHRLGPCVRDQQDWIDAAFPHSSTLVFVDPFSSRRSESGGDGCVCDGNLHRHPRHPLHVTTSLCRFFRMSSAAAMGSGRIGMHEEAVPGESFRENLMNIAFVGSSGFPYLKEASISRLRTIAELIVKEGGQVFVLNRLAVAAPSDDATISMPGIQTIEVTGSRFRDTRFIQRNLKKLFAPFLELTHLFRLHRQHSLKVLHVYTQDSFPVLGYALFAKVFGLELVNHCVEMRSHIEYRKSALQHLNERLLDGLLLKLFDRFIAISSLLEDHIRKVAPGKPILKIPPVCDFNWFSTIPAPPASAPYFVYCGSANYSEVINFILDAWRSIPDENGYSLKLVVNGLDSQLLAIREQIQSMERVELLSKLPYVDLIRLYKGARGLLIPLRPTVQDRARFPQKCCEYLASGRLVITTKVGEMGAYFEDGQNALVSESFDALAFGAKIREAIEDPAKADAIARQGQETGLRHFDATAYRTTLYRFLSRD